MFRSFIVSFPVEFVTVKTYCIRIQTRRQPLEDFSWHSSKVFFKEFNNASPTGIRYADWTTDPVEVVIHHSAHVFVRFHRFVPLNVVTCESVLYYYYRHSATLAASYSVKNSKVYQHCPKSLYSKGLRLAGRAGPDVSPYVVRLYVPSPMRP